MMDTTVGFCFLSLLLLFLFLRCNSNLQNHAFIQEIILEVFSQKKKYFYTFRNTLVIFSFFVFTDQRLHNFTVAVGNEFPSRESFDPENFTQCIHFPGQFGASDTRVLACDEPVRGRYVTVYFKRREVLTLCEVEIHGLPAGWSLFHHKKLL